MSRAHSIVGWVFLGIFLLTGLYLRSIFPDAYNEDHAVRYLFRANHVYILFASLLNILAAPWSTPSQGRRWARAGSFAVLASPLLFLLAFLLETSPASPMRPLTVTGAFLALGGVIMLAAVHRLCSTD